MSIPTSIEAVAVVVLLFIPGYLFLQFTKSAVAFVPQSVDARYFFAVITWGGLIHGAAFYWTLSLIDSYQEGTLLEEHAISASIWAVLTLVVAPSLRALPVPGSSSRSGSTACSTWSPWTR